ncbi:hypothetical protein CLOP_g993, partial [Closterium sp. NIES-67]
LRGVYRSVKTLLDPPWPVGVPKWCSKGWMCLPLRGNSAEISWTPILVKISRELSVDSKGELKFVISQGEDE